MTFPPAKTFPLPCSCHWLAHSFIFSVPEVWWAHNREAQDVYDRLRHTALSSRAEQLQTCVKDTSAKIL